MSLVLVTPPPALTLLSLDQAKAHLRVESADEDELITAYLAAAIVAAEKATTRAFVPQTWDLFAEGFPCLVRECGIPLPLRPLISVTEVGYVDVAGVTQAWAEEDYSVYGAGAASGGVLLPAPGQSFPATACRPEAARIRFTAGYSNLQHPDLSAIRAAVLLILGDIYENREDQVIAAGTVTQIKNPASQALLAPFRVWPT